MYCPNALNNDNCGKCEYNLLSSNFVCNKPLIKIAKIATNISWMNEFSDESDTIKSIHSIMISCTDKISITRSSNTNKSINICIVKYICNTLFKNWYKYYWLGKKLDNYKFVKAKLKLIDGTSSITKIRTTLLSITKHIELATVCNGNCTTVIPYKEVSNCVFPLSDIDKISKFTLNGIVDVLNTILYTVKDFEKSNLTIDINSTYVTCKGDIVMEKSFTQCKSTVADMKRIYMYYLNAWRSSNVGKESEIAKIRYSMDKVNKVKTVSDIYDVSCDLLEVI